MGTVEKRDKHKKRRFVSPEEKLERELKDCMHCRFFWGHNNRCAKGCVRFKSGYIPGESEIREAMDRAMIMQLNLLPVARKMVLEELEMKQNG